MLASTVVNNGAVQQLQDYTLTVDAAKQIALMSGTEKGKQVRMYFIQVEKAWNSPDQIMARALQISKMKLEHNGVDTGATRLFSWLRNNGYLIRRKGTDYNMPTQKSMELGLFEIKETSIAQSNGSVTVSKTPKVTGNELIN